MTGAYIDFLGQFYYSLPIHVSTDVLEELRFFYNIRLASVQSFRLQLVQPRSRSWPPLRHPLFLCTARLPSAQYQVNDVINAHILLYLGENGWPPFPHLPRIPLHDAQIGTHGFGQVRLIDDQQVALRDARAALPGDLVTTADINHVNDEIGQFSRVVGGQVVAPGLDEQQVCRELAMEVLEGREIGGYVLAHGGVRTPTRLDGADPLRRESGVAGEELGVFAGEDVVGDGGKAVLLAEGEAQGQHEGGFARAHGSEFGVS